MALHFSTSCSSMAAGRSAAPLLSALPVPCHVAAPLRAPQWESRCGNQGATFQARRATIANVIVRSRTERADDDIAKTLYSAEQIHEVLEDLGRQLGHDYEGKQLLVLGVLKGGFMFTSDLIRHISPVPASLEVDFFKASSYGLGIQSAGEVKLDDSFDLTTVKDKHVVVAEDIIDTGLTMSSIVSLLRKAGAMSVRVCVLLDKRSRRKCVIDPDYVGMICPDEFVVGYGIDFAERYRWLPYIGVPKPEVVKRLIEERTAKGVEQAKQAEAAKAKQAEAVKQLEAAAAAASAPGAIVGNAVSFKTPVGAGVASNGAAVKPLARMA